MKSFRILMVAVLCMVAMAASALAADYPTKPITIMTAFNPGGGSDVSHRLLEKYARGIFDEPLVITYKPGAGGEIGWTTLALSKPDGYTVGGVDLPHIVLQPMLRRKGQPGYKTEDLLPLCGLVYDANVAMVRADSQWKTLADLVAYAKANPGKVRVASVGKFSGDHLFLMQIEKATGAKFAQVPYAGSGKAIPALVTGEVDAYFGSGSSFLRMENTRGLAVATEERYELCPDVPTFKEQGYNIISMKFRGLAVPRKVPANVLNYLESHFATVCGNREYMDAVKNSGLMPAFSTGKEFADIIAREKSQAEQLLKEFNIIN